MLRLLRLAVAAVVLAVGSDLFAQSGGSFQVPRGQMTFDAEGLEKPGHPGHSRRLHWPGGASGVTIGRGYDMKERTPEEVLADLKAAGVPEEIAKRYAAGAGLAGDRAEAFVQDNREALPELAPEEQRKLFGVIYPRYVDRVREVADRADVVKKYGRIDWEKIDPNIVDVLVDLRYRGDYTATSRRVVQSLAVKGDLKGLFSALENRDNWPGVPCDRFHRRIDHVRVVLARQALTTTGKGTPGARIIFDDTQPKNRTGYRTPAMEKIGRTATEQARMEGYLPKEGRQHSAEFVRDLARKLAGKDRPELDGKVPDQYARLLQSPSVERLWVPEKLSKVERDRLTTLEGLFDDHTKAQQVQVAARKSGDRKALQEATAQVNLVRQQIQSSSYCFRQALREAQQRANEGAWVVVVAPSAGQIGWLVPTRGLDGDLRPALTWADLPLPHVAYAGKKVEGYAGLDALVSPTEAVADLAVFVLKPE